MEPSPRHGGSAVTELLKENTTGPAHQAVFPEGFPHLMSSTHMRQRGEGEARALQAMKK